MISVLNVIGKHSFIASGFKLGLSATNVCSNQHVVFYSKKESLEKRLGLPEKPKHPLNSYLRFTIDARNTLVNSNLKPKEVSVKLGEMWKNLSDNEKQKYIVIYKKEHDEYIQKLNDYNNSLTEEQKKHVKTERLEELHEKNTNRKVREKASERRNRLQQLGKPKRPLSSFLLFLNEERQKSSEQINLSDIKEKWYKLSDERRAQYNANAAKSFDAYKKQLYNWEEKMEASGNLDVVRAKSAENTSPDNSKKPKPQ